MPQFKILLYTAQLANDKIVTYAAKSFSWYNKIKKYIKKLHFFSSPNQSTF